MSGMTGGREPRPEEALHQHIVRLITIAEMGLIDMPPSEQLQRILLDARDALQYDYAEAGETSSGRYTRVCGVGPDAERIVRGVGEGGITREKPLMIFDTQRDETAVSTGVCGLGMRSVMFWPFSSEGKRCVLVFAWKNARPSFVSEDEIRYIEFLAAVVSRVLDVLERQRAMAHRADTDPLTGIPNRGAMLELLDVAVSASERDASRLALLYIDLNNFKRVNDQNGHAVGDVALRAIAQRLKSVLRKHEICARYGGDEFCLIITHFKDDAELAVVARRLLDALSEPIAHDGLVIAPSASIGIAVHPQDGKTAAELLSTADSAMYRAKRAGGSTFAFHGNGEVITVERRLEVEPPAVRQQFVLCFQPIVCARTTRPIGAEVLARWLHPDGMRAPETFLRVAREQGTLRELELSIARTAVECAEELRDVAHVVYHVNVSEPNVALLDVVSAQRALIAVEVSEGAIAADVARFIAFSDMCRVRGIRFGISDFTSDRLSLRVLTELHADFMKVRGAAEGPARGSLGRVIDSAHHLSAYVIAEAVETPSEYQWLVANGVDALQGFEISSPLTHQDFGVWLRRYRSAAVR